MHTRLNYQKLDAHPLLYPACIFLQISKVIFCYLHCLFQPNLAKAYVKQITIHGKKTNVGVIELPSFYGSSGKGPKATDDVEELITKLKSFNIKGLILDLRRNGGGYLSEAVNLTGLFITRGPVVQVKNTDGKIRKKFDFNPKISWNGPLFTLVSRYSASASEIVAGALQDHNRAIIVGDESTHGKGTVQSMIQMNLPFNLLSNRTQGKTSAAKITIQKYYLPSGKSTQINLLKKFLSKKNYKVIGIDNVDDYYSVKIKYRRIKEYCR